jgi:nucleoside-diphosphate-sugar epimerase
VYASGCGLYDAFDPREKDENARLIPRTHYQAAKLEGELRFASLQHACIARLSSPYHEEMREGSVLVRFLDAARRGEALQVWGTGQREQDFIHCSDIGDFISRAVRAGASGVFNVAQGCPATMAGLAQASVRVAGRGQVHIGSREDPEERATARISIEKAKRVLGWMPRISLDQGLALCLGKAECKTSHDL